MKIQVLGCSGAIAHGCRTTAFLLDDDVLVDAGTGVGDLPLDLMASIDHVFITHAHLDHVAALPLMLDAVASSRLARGAGAVTVHALQETIDALRAHLFNGLIWPDFTCIPTPELPLLAFSPLQVGDTWTDGRKTVEALPAVHSVPAVGFAAWGSGGAWVFSGDTGRNPAFWRRVNQLPVAQLVIETAFSDRESELARRSQHLSPGSLAEELAAIAPGSRYPICITHTKPAETALIMDEIHRLEAVADHDIRWLQAGQTFEI